MRAVVAARDLNVEAELAYRRFGHARFDFSEGDLNELAKVLHHRLQPYDEPVEVQAWLRMSRAGDVSLLIRGTPIELVANFYELEQLGWEFNLYPDERLVAVGVLLSMTTNHLAVFVQPLELPPVIN